MGDTAEVSLGSLVVRPAGRRTHRVVLELLAVFALALGLVQLGVGWELPATRPILVAFTLVYWTWAGAGIIALWLRPSSGTGALLVLGALAIFISSFGGFDVPAFAVLSAVFATTILAVTIHLLHAFPSGRVRGRLSAITVVSVYVVSLVLEAPLYLLSPEQSTLRTVASWVQTLGGLAVVGATVVYLVGRYRTAGARNRRVLAPLYTYGVLAVLLIPVSARVFPLFGADAVVVGATQLAVVAGIPIVFLIGVLAGRFTRTTEADALSAWLGLSGSTRTTVEGALAQSLGDDSLSVVYWSDERAVFVDPAGADVDAPDSRSHRLRQQVHVESRLVGAIDYDGRMVDDAESVRRAGQVLAMALDRERLTAALVASNTELGLSRLRIVEAADSERARIARDLHDGLQMQLVLLALDAQQLADADATPEGTAAAATALRRRIDEAATDLRRLVHQVLPSALHERGLVAATEDLMDRLDMPATLDTDVDDRSLDAATAQTAYLIAAEALTNAVKHSEAASVTVGLHRTGDILRIVVADDGRGGARVDGGTGLKGLIDRVDAVGGTFGLTSEPGVGTRLRAELPCAS